MTPTGASKCMEYKDEATHSCIKLKFDEFNIIIGKDNEIQTSNGSWITADKVKVGDEIKIYDGECKVKKIETLDNVDCCSIKVEDGEYYLDGVITK